MNVRDGKELLAFAFAYGLITMFLYQTTMQPVWYGSSITAAMFAAIILVSMVQDWRLSRRVEVPAPDD